jgi:hypothetical protein
MTRAPRDVVRLQANGNLLVPATVYETAEGEGAAGVRFVELEPGTADYDRWVPYLHADGGLGLPAERAESGTWREPSRARSSRAKR